VTIRAREDQRYEFFIRERSRRPNFAAAVADNRAMPISIGHLRA